MSHPVFLTPHNSILESTAFPPSLFFSYCWFIFVGLGDYTQQGKVYLCQGTLIMMPTGKIVNLQCLLFYISNKNGKTCETNLVGLSALSILENIVNNCLLCMWIPSKRVLAHVMCYKSVSCYCYYYQISIDWKPRSQLNHIYYWKKCWKEAEEKYSALNIFENRIYTSAVFFF